MSVLCLYLCMSSWIVLNNRIAATGWLVLGSARPVRKPTTTTITVPLSSFSESSTCMGEITEGVEELKVKMNTLTSGTLSSCTSCTSEEPDLLLGEHCCG